MINSHNLTIARHHLRRIYIPPVIGGWHNYFWAWCYADTWFWVFSQGKINETACIQLEYDGYAYMSNAVSSSKRFCKNGNIPYNEIGFIVYTKRFLAQPNQFVTQVLAYPKYTIRLQQTVAIVKKAAVFLYNIHILYSDCWQNTIFWYFENKRL